MATLGELRVQLSADLMAFKRGMASAAASLAKVEIGSKSLSSSVGKMGLAFVGVTGAVVATQKALRGVGASVTKFAGLESQLTRVAAISGATGEQMARLTETAETLGRTTVFTGQQAAEGMTFLAMAGNDVNTIISAMPATLQLAQAAAVDLGQAADVVTNIMAGFGIAASDLAKTNDTLVATFTGSNVTLEEMGQSFKFVGPVAKSLGVTFEDTAAAVGILGNAGLKTSVAGVGLRRALTSVVNASPKARKALNDMGVASTDASKGFTVLVKKLEAARATMTKEEFTGKALLAFGDRAGPVMAALVEQGSAAIEKLSRKIGGAGGLAEKIQKMELDTFRGQMKLLESAVDGLAVSFGRNLAPSIRQAVEMMTDFLNVVGGSGARDLAKTREEFERMQRANDQLAMTERLIANLSARMKRGFRSAGEAAEVLNEQFLKVTGVGFAEFAKSERAFRGLRMGEVLVLLKQRASFLRKELGQLGKVAKKTAKSVETVTPKPEEQPEVKSSFGETLRLLKKQADIAKQIQLGISPKEGRKLAGVLASINARLGKMRDSGGDLQDTFESVARAMIRAAAAIEKATFAADRKQSEALSAGIARVVGETRTVRARQDTAVAQDVSSGMARVMRELQDAMARSRDVALGQSQAMQRANTAFSAALGGIVQDFGAGVLNIVSRFGEALAESVGVVVDSIAQLVLADPQMQQANAAFMAAFAPLATAAATLAGVIFAPLIAFATLMSPIALALAVTVGPLIALSAALSAAVVVVVSAVAAFATIVTLAVAIATGFAAIAASIGAFLAALVVGPAVILGVAAALFTLTAETEAFKQVTDAMGVVVKRVITALEPFAMRLISLVGLLSVFVDAMMPVIDAFASSPAVAKLLFDAVRGLAVAFVQLTSATFSIANALLTVGEVLTRGMIGVVQAIQSFVSMFSAEAAANLNNMVTAMNNAADAMRDLRVDTSAMDQGAQALRDLTFEDATRAGQAIATTMGDVSKAASAVVDSFQGLTEESGNLPQFFRVAEARRAGEIPGFSSPPGGDSGAGAPSAVGTVNIVIESISLPATNPTDFLQLLAEELDVQHAIRTGSTLKQTLVAGGAGG